MKEKKFISEFNISDYDILTDDGWKPINKIYKTIKYNVYKLTTATKTLKCADTHLIFTNDNVCKNLIDIVSTDKIITDAGVEDIISIDIMNYKEHMYDISVDYNKHAYYTNGILSHNTSLAKAISLEFNHPTKYINCSKDTGVDVIREELTEFCANQSLQTLKKSNPTKVVILDELDGASPQFYKALRATMEEFKHVRFIATCNYLNRIPEPLQDRRFEVINFEFTDEDSKELRQAYGKRLLQICKNEELKLVPEKIIVDGEDEIVSPLTYLFDKYFPDMAAMLNILQGFKTEGKFEITVSDVKKSYSVYKNIFSVVCNFEKSENVFKLVTEQYANKIDSLLSALSLDFVKYIQEEHPNFEKHIPQIIIKNAEYQSKKSLVIDEILVPLALIYELQEILKK